MRTISAQSITDTVARLCIEANTRLPQDVEAALARAREEEPWPLAKTTLDLLWSNLGAAQEKALPICQDTGMACVFVELGTDVHIDGSFEAAIHEGVRRGYTDGYLRKSIVADPLRRGNTGDNTPAAITVHLVDGDGCTITVAPKGFGSENMSRIQMLKPADGVEGFKKFVLETVTLAGSNPCPPIVLGIGVGGSFDKVAYLAKKALLRPLDIPNPDPYYAALERELLAAVNETGIGPQGFGGRTTCLGLAIEQMPTHVAGLPVAVNVSCHVTRRAAPLRPRRQRHLLRRPHTGAPRCGHRFGRAHHQRPDGRDEPPPAGPGQQGHDRQGQAGCRRQGSRRAQRRGLSGRAGWGRCPDGQERQNAGSHRLAGPRLRSRPPPDRGADAPDRHSGCPRRRPLSLRPGSLPRVQISTFHKISGPVSGQNSKIMQKKLSLF